MPETKSWMMRYLGAGLTTGIITGLICGALILEQNWMGGVVERFLFLCVAAGVYALVLVVPAAVTLALLGRTLSRQRANRASSETADFGTLLGAGFLLVGLFLAARLAAEVLDVGFAALRNNGAAIVALTVGGLLAAWLVGLTWRSVAEWLGTFWTTAAGVLLAVLTTVVIALLVSPSPPERAGSTAYTPHAYSSEEDLAPQSPRRKVALIGFDGLDTDVLAPLVRTGETPTFAELQRVGASDLLETLAFGLSPPIWTTMSTGVDPGVHGIHDFVTRELRLTNLDLSAVKRFPRRFGARTLFDYLFATPLIQEHLVTPLDRDVPAIWSLASAAGVQCCVVDWMGSWPSEPVAGTMVSDRAFLASNLGALALDPSSFPGENLPLRLRSKNPVLNTSGETEGTCFPEPECLSLFPTAHSQPLDPARDAVQFHLSENSFYLDIALRLLQQNDCQLFVFYSHLPDFLNHKLLPAELENVTQGRYLTENEKLVREVYSEVDRTLGALLAHLASDVSVLVVSDHGVEIVGDGPHRKVNHSRGPAGAFYFRPSSGHRLPRLQSTPSVFDIAPTVLALLGLPVTSQMQSAVLDDVITVEFGEEHVVRVVEADGWAQGNPMSSDEVDRDADEVEETLKNRLRSLGYIN